MKRADDTLISPLRRINLEDISAAPGGPEIEDRSRRPLDSPVFHGDQHGTAVVVLAALTNALQLVGQAHGRREVVVAA